jgi:hypothetical protein
MNIVAQGEGYTLKVGGIISFVFLLIFAIGLLAIGGNMPALLASGTTLIICGMADLALGIMIFITSIKKKITASRVVSIFTIVAPLVLLVAMLNASVNDQSVHAELYSQNNWVILPYGLNLLLLGAFGIVNILLTIGKGKRS